MIGTHDILYHLGDVHFGTEQQLKDILKSIRGRKYLIRGNHDKWSDTKYLMCGFDSVSDGMIVNNCILTHKPVELHPSFMYNIHGHIHNLKYDDEAFGEEFNIYKTLGHILYSPEMNNYMPIHLDGMISNRDNIVIKELDNIKKNMIKIFPKNTIDKSYSL
jgi:calcineurin-like phosphoesterase family protein